MTLPAEKHSWDFLSEREALYTEGVIKALGEQDILGGLAAMIAERGGLTQATKPLLFEARFAYALHQAGVAIRYEVPGEGDSTIDFGFDAGGRAWRVELMRLEETRAVKDATAVAVDADGIEWATMSLSSTADDKKQSQEGETLKAVERICQKCERGGRPHKFPAPEQDVHVLLVDLRTFMDGGDKQDRLHIALGSDAVGGWFKMSWKGKPIGGVFAGENPSKGTALIRERVHLLGFVDEKEFTDGAFGKSVQFVANPNLFADESEVQALIDAWPLQPTVLLNTASVAGK